MTAITSAMIIEEEYGNFYTISLDSFNKKPYTRTPVHKIITEDNKSIYETKYELFKGDIIDIKHNAEDKIIWTKKSDYKDHNYEYAVVLEVTPITDTKTKLTVYGNKIDIQEAYSTLNSKFQPGHKVLLERNGKIYSAIHNITNSKLIYDMQINGPKVK